MGSSSGSGFTGSRMLGKLKWQPHTAQNFSLVNILANSGAVKRKPTVRTQGKRIWIIERYPASTCQSLLISQVRRLLSMRLNEKMMERDSSRETPWQQKHIRLCHPPDTHKNTRLTPIRMVTRLLMKRRMI